VLSAYSAFLKYAYLWDLTERSDGSSRPA
jgi:hypothetical protein